MSRRYLMMPNLPKEEALFQNVVAAFVEKAIFSEAELVIVWEKEEDIQTYLGRWLYGLPVQAGRFRHLLRTNLQEGQEGQLLSDAIRFANKAASISVTRMGAWRSIPRRVELS